MNRALIAALLLAPAFAGCLAGEWEIPLTDTDFAAPADLSGSVAAADLTWPDFDGATLRILDHGAFPGCEDMGALFQDLTNAAVECTSAADTGSALQRAIQGKGDPEFDILYGADNLLMHQAIAAGVFQDYTPQLASRVPAEFLFFDDGHDDHDHPWPATPVDHGYIALNIDPRHDALDQGTENTTDDIRIENLFHVRTHADKFVTQDPRTSTPGLGFLLTTVRVFGEDDSYDWQDYWTELFEGGVKITPGWSEAYETHFSGGYGVFTEGHLGDRPIVTSYTESPAFELYYEAEHAADVLMTHGFSSAVLHQIQTMAILAGTENQAVAEAWIEFTLTDDFQAIAAPFNAVYPVVSSPDVDAATDDVYGDNDPEPGTFDVVDYSYLDHGDDVERWVAEWVALCEDADCA